MRIRDMLDEDLGEIERIHQATSGTADLDRFRRRVAVIRSRPQRGMALVAGKGSDSIICGYLLGEARAMAVESCSAAGWILALGVDPLYHREEVGRYLLERALVRFREMEIPIVRTAVPRKEIDLLDFFQHEGFEISPYLELERPI